MNLKWLRQQLAWLFCMWQAEDQSHLYDYANGQWELIHSVIDAQSAGVAIALVENMWNSGRDAIYISTTMLDYPGCGVIAMITSNRTVFQRFFIGEIYPIDEAMSDVVDRVKLEARKMGFKEPMENENERT